MIRGTKYTELFTNLEALEIILSEIENYNEDIELFYQNIDFTNYFINGESIFISDVDIKVCIDFIENQNQYHDKGDQYFVDYDKDENESIIVASMRIVVDCVLQENWKWHQNKESNIFYLSEERNRLKQGLIKKEN